MSTEANTEVEEQAAQQTGQKKVRLRVDQRDMDTCYANSFRPISSTEELFIDFGVNQTFPVQGGEKGTDASAEIVFSASSRVIMNYYTAKRLGLAINQLVGQYEKNFGEVKLNVNDRRVED